jgi:hypothetical protein
MLKCIEQYVANFGLTATLLFLSLSSSPADAVAPSVYSPVFKAAVVLSANPDRDSVKRFEYKTVKMLKAAYLWDENPELARTMPTHPLDFPPPPDQQPRTRDEFLRRVSTHVDLELEGLKLGDIPETRILTLGLAGAVALVTKKLDPFTAAVLGAGAGDAQAGINGIQIREPKRFNELSFDSTIGLLEEAEKKAAEDPEFKKYYDEELRKHGKMSSVADAELDSAWTNFQLKAETDGNTARITKLETNAHLNENVALLEDGITQISKKQDTLIDAQKQAAQARAAFTRYEADRKRQVEAELKRQRELEAEFMTGQAVLSVFERLATNIGAPRQAITALQNVKKADGAIYGLMQDLKDPRALVAAYENLALVFVDILMPQNEGDQNDSAQIMDALKSLAEQIDELRSDMISRFDKLDENLAEQFANQRKMLDLIIAYQQGQAIELGKIRDDIQSSAQALKEYIEAHFKHEQKVELLECFSLKPNEQEKRRRCALDGLVLAAETSKTAEFRESSFSNLFNIALKADSPIGILTVLTNRFNSVLHLYADIHNKKLEIPNPDAYSRGATLMLEAMVQDPAILKERYMAKWKEVLVTGQKIQKFYRTAYNEETPEGHYRVNGQMVTNQLEQYKDRALKFINYYAATASQVQYPWEHPNQSLPAEEAYIPPPSQPPVAVNFVRGEAPPNAPVVDFVNVTKTRKASDLRGIFNEKADNIYRAFLGSSVGYCNDKVDEFVGRDTGVYDADILARFQPDFNEIKSRRGLKLLDRSVLSLVPREALWLTVIDPGKYKLSACVSRIYAYMDFTSATTALEGHPTTDIRLAMDLKFLLNAGNIQVYVSGASMSMAIVAPSLPVQSSRKNLLASLFEGESYGSVQTGPIRGNMDKYFKPMGMPNSEEVTQLLNQLVESERADARNKVSTFAESGEVRSLRDQLIEQYRKLMSLRFITTGGVPEADAMLDLLETKDNVLTAKQIQEAFLTGSTEKEVKEQLRSKVSQIEDRITFLGGRVLDGPPPTPVDAVIAELSYFDHLQFVATQAARSHNSPKP